MSSRVPSPLLLIWRIWMPPLIPIPTISPVRHAWFLDIAEHENDEMHFLNWWMSYDVCRSHVGTRRSSESRQRGGLEEIFADTIVLICCTVAEDWKYIASLLAF